ncbi:cystatin [Oryzias melastigma]|uniref:Cystatin-like n=1 Tax=Oryzias melastigma TaxID=30732 RepID=A0A3B3CPC1_ORYME|nr:cystatin [Oryzias melastigma]
MMWKLAFAFLAVLLAVGFGQNPDGGTDVNANDPEVQAALKLAMEEYNKASPDIYFFKVVKVIRAQITPREGYKCTLTVMIARTVCRKGRPANWCPVFINPDRAKSYRCTFVVRYNEWAGIWMLVDQECH